MLVIGIAALGNSPLVSPIRDREIGWVTNEFVSRFASAALEAQPQELQRLTLHLETLIASALGEINIKGIATEAELAAPNEEIVA